MLASILGIIINIVSFLFILGVLVIVHEWGHFWVARKCGVKVEEFAFGLPPRLWSWKKGDTVYAINAIPFGGYVRMLGQDDFDPTESKKSRNARDKLQEKSKDEEEKLPSEHFEAKTWWQKSLILCAGVAMNIILAIVLLSVGYMIGMRPMIPESPLFDSALRKDGVVIHQIIEDSLAVKLEIPRLGRIQKINEVPVENTSQLHNAIAGLRSRGFTLTVSDKVYTIPVLKTGELIGLQYGESATLKNVQLPPGQAIYYGALDSVLILKETFVGFGGLIVDLVSKGSVSQDVTGPVGIFKLTGEVTKNGPVPFLQLIALLSLSLAAVNIVPFPALDGGRLFFVWLEAIFPKRWNKLLEGKIHLVGMILLLLFMVAITYKDIAKLF